MSHCSPNIGILIRDSPLILFTSARVGQNEHKREKWYYHLIIIHVDRDGITSCVFVAASATILLSLPQSRSNVHTAAGLPSHSILMKLDYLPTAAWSSYPLRFTRLHLRLSKATYWCKHLCNVLPCYDSVMQRSKTIGNNQVRSNYFIPLNSIKNNT